MASKKKKVTDERPKVSTENRTLLTSLASAMKLSGVSIVEDGTIADSNEFIGTGHYLTNMQISGDFWKGIPVGQPVEVAGESGSAKTYYMMSWVDSFLGTFENALVLVFDTEAGLNKKRIEERGLDSSRILYVPIGDLPELRTSLTLTLNEINDPIKGKKYQGKKIMFVIDSIGQPPSAKEQNDAAEGKDAQDMTRAKFIRSIFRILRAKLLKNRITLLVSNHIYQKVSGNPYEDPRVIAGGGGHIFFCDIVLMLSRSQYKEGDVRVGNYVTTYAMKSRDTIPFTRVKAALSFKHGLHPYYGLPEVAVEAKVWEKVRGGYLVNGETVDEVTILRDAEKYFTTDIMETLNRFLKPKFTYGDKGDDIYKKNEIIDPVAEEEKPKDVIVKKLKRGNPEPAAEPAAGGDSDGDENPEDFRHDER